jgi:hypothetical protein
MSALNPAVGDTYDLISSFQNAPAVPIILGHRDCPRVLTTMPELLKVSTYRFQPKLPAVMLRTLWRAQARMKTARSRAVARLPTEVVQTRHRRSPMESVTPRPIATYGTSYRTITSTSWQGRVQAGMPSDTLRLYRAVADRFVSPG